MPTARPAVPTAPAPQRVLCPYCGEISVDPRRCDACRGFFDPLSRQATQNAMGPWFIRDDSSPWRPGCSIETLRELIRRGKVTPDTIIRGPGTKQFWNFAGRTPSIANLLGLCHNCRKVVKPDDFSCKGCGAAFTPDPDRQHMGLAPVHMLPGEASPEMVAAASLDTPAPVPVPAAMPSQMNSVAQLERPRPTTAPEVRRAVPEPPPERLKKGRGIGPWLVGATVVIVVAMGTVFALVATGNLSLPWLTGDIPKAPPVMAPVAPKAAPTPPPPTEQPSEVPTPNPAGTGEPGPVTQPPSPAKDPGPQIPASPDLKVHLLPLLNAVPYDHAAMLKRIEELRLEHPSLAAELDEWVKVAGYRAEQIRLRRIP